MYIVTSFWASHVVLVDAGDIRDTGSVPGSWRSPGESPGNPLIFLPGKSHRQRSLVGCGPQGRKGLDRTGVTYHTCNFFLEKDFVTILNHYVDLSRIFFFLTGDFYFNLKNLTSTQAQIQNFHILWIGLTFCYSTVTFFIYGTILCLKVNYAYMTVTVII